MMNIHRKKLDVVKIYSQAGVNSHISSSLHSISADTQTDLPLERAEMQVRVGLHLNSAICIPARRPGSQTVYIDEQIDLALVHNQQLTRTLIIRTDPSSF